MKVLALESATLSGGAALVGGERLLGEVTLDVAVTHSERLMAAVDRLVADCGLSPHDLDGLAVSIGPGSFTGLRVGIATAKGLGLALDLPIAAVPTLDALAGRLPFADTPVCPILDARKGEVYLSRYRGRPGHGQGMGLSGPLSRGGRGPPRAARDLAGRRHRRLPAMARAAW